jgi:hypothetical protein
MSSFKVDGIEYNNTACVGKDKCYNIDTSLFKTGSGWGADAIASGSVIKYNECIGSTDECNKQITTSIDSPDLTYDGTKYTLKFNITNGINLASTTDSADTYKRSIFQLLIDNGIGMKHLYKPDKIEDFYVPNGDSVVTLVFVSPIHIALMYLTINHSYIMSGIPKNITNTNNNVVVNSDILNSIYAMVPAYQGMYRPTYTNNADTKWSINIQTGFFTGIDSGDDKGSLLYTHSGIYTNNAFPNPYEQFACVSYGMKKATDSETIPNSSFIPSTMSLFTQQNNAILSDNYNISCVFTQDPSKDSDIMALKFQGNTSIEGDNLYSSLAVVFIASSPIPGGNSQRTTWQYYSSTDSYNVVTINSTQSSGSLTYTDIDANKPSPNITFSGVCCVVLHNVLLEYTIKATNEKHTRILTRGGADWNYIYLSDDDNIQLSYWSSSTDKFGSWTLRIGGYKGVTSYTTYASLLPTNEIKITNTDIVNQAPIQNVKWGDGDDISNIIISQIGHASYHGFL